MNHEGPLIILGLMAAFLGGVALGSWVQRTHYQGKAIEYGAAQYHPTTGDFCWIKEDVR